jgi:Tol biopolymer transport system component
VPVWVDRSGKAGPLPLPPRCYLHPSISPDGRQLAIEIEGPTHDFWTYDFGRGTLTKISLDGVSHWPLWTPDGRRLTFRIWREGSFSMWWMPEDRSGPEERLTTIGSMQSASSWSPDGRVVAFTQIDLDTGPDVWVLPIGERKPRPFAQTKFAEGSPKFSPDGWWIAYVSNESGRNEIYVQAYPGPGPKIQVSAEGGTDPVWKGKGGELYYRNGDYMMAVAVSTHGVFKASKSRALWQGRYAHGMSSACGAAGTTSSNYDVTSDGQRFLMIKEDETAPDRIHVALNWTEELKRLTQSKKN